MKIQHIVRILEIAGFVLLVVGMIGAMWGQVMAIWPPVLGGLGVAVFLLGRVIARSKR